MPQRRNLTFTDEAIAIMESEATAGTLGDWVSMVIVDYVAILRGTEEDPECGVLESIDNRLALIQKQNADLSESLRRLSGRNTLRAVDVVEVGAADVGSHRD